MYPVQVCLSALRRPCALSLLVTPARVCHSSISVHSSLRSRRLAICPAVLGVGLVWRLNLDLALSATAPLASGQPPQVRDLDIATAVNFAVRVLLLVADLDVSQEEDEHSGEAEEG